MNSLQCGLSRLLSLFLLVLAKIIINPECVYCMQYAYTIATDRFRVDTDVPRAAEIKLFSKIKTVKRNNDNINASPE